ncbi:MAG: hypothetical protein ABII97_00900 [Patescibacteria group bacterium]
MQGIFSNKEKAKGELVAVFDVASGSVGGLLFRRKKDGLPEILTTKRHSVNISKKMSPERLVQVIQAGLKVVSKHIQSKYKEKISFALCVFSSPWYVAQTKITKVSRDHEFEVDEELMEELIQDEIQDFKKEWDQTSDSAARDKQNIFLEHEFIKSVLNGYTVENPKDKTVKNLEAHVYLSMCPYFVKKKIKDCIIENSHTSSVRMQSFPFVLFKILNKLINTKEAAIFVDISGKITDVFVIRDHTIEEIASFTKGENYFIKKISGGLNLSKEEARSRFLQYQRKELDDSQIGKMRDIVQESADNWGDDLKELLKEMGKDKYLPQNLYFCGNTTLLKEITEQTSGEDFIELTMFRKPFNVRFLLPHSLKYHFDFIKGFSGSKDIFLLISALYANHFIEHK